LKAKKNIGEEIAAFIGRTYGTDPMIKPAKMLQICRYVPHSLVEEIGDVID